MAKRSKKYIARKQAELYAAENALEAAENAVARAKAEIAKLQKQGE